MMKEDPTRMPLNQSKLLIKFWDYPNKTGFAEGKSEGGSIKELLAKGYVTPAGRVGRRIRWRINENLISQKDINILREIVR